jgi:23S rRNA pseudouridine1911/1915/1917 synthase
VVAVVAGVSRAAAKQMVADGTATFDGTTLDPADRVAAGAVLDYEPPAGREPLAAEPMEFGVLFEDEHLAVIDKPPGLVVHPGAGRRQGTLAAGILHRWPGVRGVGDEDRWGIVHRLDRDTSGAMVVGLTHEAFAGLRAAIKARGVEREYVALVAGVPEAPVGTVDAPLGRDPQRPTLVRVDRDGRPAVTHFEVEEALPGVTVLKVRLETGRTHQIRAHLKSIGLPVVGDIAYGGPPGAPRVFLHARRLAFDHPATGARVEVEAPLPPDLAEVLDRLRSQAP